MSLTERTQILLTPAQKTRLERLARHRGSSVGSVIRAAIDAYTGDEHADQLLDELFGLDLPVGDWAQMKDEIIDAASR